MVGRAEQDERVCERALVWHLGHFRLSDHAGLGAAATEARTVFPLVVRDPADPLTALGGYAAAVRALSRDYDELGAHLCYLEGEPKERVVDAARDARADYVYLLARQDEAGARLLELVVEELELWGFKSHIFADSLFGASGGLRELEPKPASLSGHPLPSQALPAGPVWGEQEAAAHLREGADDEVLGEALALGLLSPRQLWDLIPQLRHELTVIGKAR